MSFMIGKGGIVWYCISAC